MSCGSWEGSRAALAATVTTYHVIGHLCEQALALSILVNVIKILDISIMSRQLPNLNSYQSQERVRSGEGFRQLKLRFAFV